MADIHLEIGTSSVHRLINCPASLTRSRKAPKASSGSAATEGSLLHLVMEKLYADDIEPESLVGELSYEGLTLTQEMVDNQVEPAITATESLLDLVDADELIVEQFVEYIPKLAGGTLDLIAVSSDEETVLLSDLKFGYNPVSPQENSQILMAALCARTDPATADVFKKADLFIGAIVQPKVNGDKPLTWEFVSSDIDDFEDDLEDAMALAEGETPPAKAGDHCHYCPAAPTCETKIMQGRSALVIDPLVAATMSEAMSMVDQLEKWCKAVKSATHASLEHGGEVEGWKLVQKRATRQWTDEEAVVDMVRKAKKIKMEDAFSMKLLSVAQLEKVVKAKKLPFDKYALHVASVSTGTTLAPESDKRPAVGRDIIPQNMLQLIE
jgi:hypothetical protein